MCRSLEEIPIGSELTSEQARAIFGQGEEAVVFALLELRKQLAEAQEKLNPSTHPSTPSGMVPPYLKPSPKDKRRGRGKKKPGAQAGHQGQRRKKPDRVDRQQDHRADNCPDCGGKLRRCAETRIRYTEDIADTHPEVTEHTIHRDWCPHCRKKVEPIVSSALPGSNLGNSVLVLSAWLHYALGNTLSQIVEVFNFHLQMQISQGGLVAMWQRLQGILYEWYEQIQREALQSALLHADETGWRVDGKTHWLWCFGNDQLTYYMIDRSRGSPALQKFFIQEFEGTLVTDFWGAYNAVSTTLRQTCLVHLLRELEQTEKYKSPGAKWEPFAKKLRRLLGDAIRLWKAKTELTADTYASRRERLEKRLEILIETDWDNQHARRLIKRLRRHREDLLTFLHQDNVPFENNHAERSIRPAVIIRKNSYGNRSEKGVDCQAVLMSVLRTLKQRGHDPIRTVVQAIEQYLATGKLPPLPPRTTSDG